MSLYWLHGFSRMPSAPVKIQGGLGAVCHWFLWFCASAFLVTHGDPSQIIPISGSQNQRTGRRMYHDESWKIFGNELLIIFSWSWPLLCLWSGASEILPLPVNCRPLQSGFFSVWHVPEVKQRRLYVFRIQPHGLCLLNFYKMEKACKPQSPYNTGRLYFLRQPTQGLGLSLAYVWQNDMKNLTCVLMIFTCAVWTDGSGIRMYDTWSILITGVKAHTCLNAFNMLTWNVPSSVVKEIPLQRKETWKVRLSLPESVAQVGGVMSEYTDRSGGLWASWSKQG